MAHVCVSTHTYTNYTHTYEILKDANEWGSLGMLSCFSNYVSSQGGTFERLPLVVRRNSSMFVRRQSLALWSLHVYAVLERREEKRKGPGTVRRI